MPRSGRDAGDLISDRRQLIGFILEASRGGGECISGKKFLCEKKRKLGTTTLGPTVLAFPAETYRRQGGRTVLPVGVACDEDWLVDQLDVERFLKALKGRRVELVDLTVPSGKVSPSDNRGDSDATESLPSHHHTKSLDSAWEYGASPEPHSPKLNLPELKIDFAEYELQEIAFTLFALCCAKPKDADLVASMRRQLELSTGRAEDISRMIKPLKNSLGPFAPQTPPGTPTKKAPEKALVDTSPSQDGPSTPAQQGSEPASPVVDSGASSPNNEPADVETLGSLPGANLELILQLLKQVRPKDFRKFKDFVRWRCALADILVQNLKYAAVTGWKGEVEAASAKSLVARLSGAVRRLSVADPEDFDEKEYGDAAEALGLAAEDLAKLTVGGWQFSWGMRVKLWEALLMTIFDDPEDGMYISAKDKILKRLQSYLGPKLEITPLLHKACLAWVHFEQFTKTLEPEMMVKTQALLEELNDSEQEEGGNELDLVYVQEVRRAVVDWVERTLMDYHTSLPEAENMEGLLGLLVAPASTKESKEHLIRECVSSSCSKASQRAVELLKDSENPMVMLKELSGAVGELFETELLKYTGHLAPFCPTAASVAAAQFHESFGQELLPELHKLTTLPEEAVAMLHAVDALEKSLLTHIDEGVDENASRPKVWDVMALVEPIIINSVKQKLNQVGDFVDRLVEGEDWEPVSKIEPVSRSAVEVKKLLVDYSMALFKLDLTFPRKAIDELLAGFELQLVAYAKATVKGLGSRDLLTPPLPQKTRYKKDMADLAERQESASKRATSFVSKMKDKIRDPAIVPVVPKTTDSKDYERISKITLSSMLVRINSLHFLQKSIPEFITMIDAKAPPSEEDEPSVAHEALTATGEQLASSLHECCAFLGDKVIFWDMRHKWLELLYRHKVVADAIYPILETLNNQVMTDVAEGSLDKVRDCVAEGLMGSCIKCYERVLLDGGPYRLFEEQDVPELESDVAKMKDFFVGGGDGIAKETVDAAFRDLSELLTVMDLPTETLIANAEDAKKAGDAQPAAIGNDLDILVKILSHRKKRDASKWLKKYFSVPKKLKTVA
ncbi:hypothetical protein BSKO_10008 [Bryopsis sp. KO-2023]|nr:hypothetical protein BSKO_10008 [Bryopsis sp. KO-2023]